MRKDRQRVHAARAFMSRRRLLAVGAALTWSGTAAARAEAIPGGGRTAVDAVPTKRADWRRVATVLGREGNVARGMIYHTDFPRRDLHVVSYGVTVSSGLALGSHVAFVRYADGTTMMMGDLVVTEDELQVVTGTLQRHGIEQSALHKHLLSHSPDVWWTHVHAHGRDAVSMADGVREALDRTGTPPARPRDPTKVDLDTEGIDAAMGTKGSHYDGVYKCTFARRETIVDGGYVLPPGLGSTSAFSFQALGSGRAAVNGDFVVVGQEVQKVLKALRRGGIKIVELHNHGLREEPRLFFIHFWGVDDAVRLAKVLRSALDVTNVTSYGGEAHERPTVSGASSAPGRQLPPSAHRA
ncbi:DUF1259 domain-containing protein [Streptomyces sp. ISL-11]|uniref:DUF1259 domain-containing protein n=1 Tax=Streptomyces sp. ISL-11 TaxID=2819174 RepID=UPI001BE9DCE6|nr:DUF1259 domain-containing protein [Streptomyces sp. ISL-11]MBT2383060.1 DUF1259 domain-containing protein [Streptomyces sp. ISL-11]